MKVRHYLFLLLSFTMIGCCTPKPAQQPIVVEKYKVDTVYIERIDTVTVVIEKPVMTDECLEYELMIMNIRHYIQITENNKNNQKFFYGWIKRAVQE